MKPSIRVSLLNKIDAYVGGIGCFLLTRWRRLRKSREKNQGDIQPKSILLLKMAEQGSTILAYEAIQRAVKMVGAKNVYFLVFEEYRFILDLLELIPKGNIFTICTYSPFTMVMSALRRLTQIRKLGVDACVDLEFFTRSTPAFAYLTGARVRVGLHAYFREGPYRGDLMTHRVIYNPHMHTSSTFTSLVRALEFSANAFPIFPIKSEPILSPPLLQVNEGERQEVVRLIAAASGGMEGPLILLNANTSDLLPLRRWDGKNYVELACRILSAFPQIRIAFTGSPDEVERSEALMQSVSSPRCFSLAGKTTLRQLLITYELAEVLVTNDSGPAHFAALTPMDVVTLFGPETPLLFGSSSPRNHSLWAGIACSPCINAFNNRQSKCSNNVCMQMLSVDMVFDTVCHIVRKRMAAKN